MIETLNGVHQLGGFDVIVMDELRAKFPEKFNESGSMDYKWFEKDIRPKNFVYVRHDVNSLSFTLQDGPVGEAGVNGCQVDTIIEAAYIILKGLNEKLHSTYNTEAMACLDSALTCLASRKHDRMIRGVEGENKP